MCCQTLRNEMPAGKGHCVEQSNVASEKGRELRLQSSTHSVICKVRVDGCLITGSDTNKCDYLLKVCDTNYFYLVELKGGDVAHAVQQIISTVQQLKDFLEGKQYEGVIVSSAIPRAADLKFRQAQEKAKKEHGLKITRHTNAHTLRV